MIAKESLAFDDVLLTPNVYSDKRSRLGGDTSTMVGPLKLRIPIVSSPMDTVTELEMVTAISRLGGLGVLHRFMPPKEQASMMREMFLPPDEKVYIVPAVGVTKDEIDRARYLYSEFGNKIDMFAIDIANGYHVLMKEAILEIQD